MKKVLTFILILAMLVGLAACGSDSTPTAEEIYLIYLAKAKSVDTFDIDVEIVVVRSANGISSETKIATNAKMVGLSSEDAKIQATTTFTWSDSGARTDMGVCYDDGWLYMDALGMKMKHQAQVGEAFILAGAVAIEDMVDIELLKDAVVTKSEDGGYQIAMKVPDDKVRKIFAGALNMVGSAEEMNFEDVALVMVFDKAYNPVSANVTFATQTEVEGVATDVDMSLTLKYNVFGDAVELTLPSFDDYVEASY